MRYMLSTAYIPYKEHVMLYAFTGVLQRFCKLQYTWPLIYCTVHVLACPGLVWLCLPPCLPPPPFCIMVHCILPSSRYQTSSIVKGRCRCIVRKSPHVKTPLYSRHSIATGCLAMTNQGRPSLQAKSRLGKQHSSVYRYSGYTIL